MADKNSRLSVRKKEKKVDSKTDDEKEKANKAVKKPDKVPKKAESSGPEKPKAAGEEVVKKDVKDGEKTPGEVKKDVKDGEKTPGGAEGMETEENGEYQPIELPPFEIITGEKMSLFYFKFQFRNVEYSSGRNKTLLCFRVDMPGDGGPGESLIGYMEDEHTTAHVEEAFFQQILPNSSQECEVTWYVSSSPCVACAAKLATVLQQRKNKLRLCIFCSRLLDWEEPEITEGLRALVRAGCKLRMMTPFDFLHVWNRYVENEDQEFTPWEDCKDNYEYYVEKLSDILK